jgi:succinate dehydrogenase / fumarate reductase membrane anchor subunit
MNMRTPLSRVRGLGSAKSGTEHFWRQRVSAVAGLVLTVILICVLLPLVGAPHARVAETLAAPLVSILLLLAIITMAVHMRIGMQVIIEDYVHGEGAKIVALLLNTFFCFGVALIGVFAVLKLSFGG